MIKKTQRAEKLQIITVAKSAKPTKRLSKGQVLLDKQRINAPLLRYELKW
jgi:hypothetical protein